MQCTATYRPSFLVIVLFIGLVFFGSIPVSAENTNSDNNTIVLYGIFPTNGTLSSSGEQAKETFSKAIDDINSFLVHQGSSKNVQGIISYMNSDPESALEAVKKFHEQGITMVIGYFSSSQLETIKDYADSEGILILSTGSSSPTLAIAGDNILRFNPDDQKQAMAVDQIWSEQNISEIIPIARDDLWGHDLVKFVSHNLSKGMTLEDGVWYDTNTTTFSAYLSQLDTKVGEVLKNTNAENVTIYAVTFDEIEPIMKEAAKPEYANLTKVRWTGCDGNAFSPALTGSTDAAEFAYNHNFTALSLGPYTDISPVIYTALKEKLNGEPNGYTYGEYDAVWIAFESHLIDGKTDASSLRDAITTISNSYTGIAGKDFKNEAGDMVEGHYNQWGLVKENGAVMYSNLGHASIWNMGGEIYLVKYYPNT
jgi:branched-chain amino acid transport system substrate-binding protein